MEIKVPAKIILFGEHSVVYPGNSAILTTINLFATFTSSKNQNDNFEITFPQINGNIKVSKGEAVACYLEAKRLRNDYLNTNDISKLRIYVNEDFNFFKIIIGLILDKISLKSFVKINIDSEIPIGSGLGSSAVMSIGVIKSLLKQNEIEFTNDFLFDLSKEMEDFQHGHSSGADPACIINEGLILYEHELNGNRKFSRKTTNVDLLKSLHLVFTGKPKETTGEMIGLVSNNKSKNEIFKKIQTLVTSLIENDYQNFNDALNSNGELLEELGVTNSKVNRFLKKVREQGGFCKVSGAGGTSGAGSGILICVNNNHHLIQKTAAKFNFKIFKH